MLFRCVLWLSPLLVAGCAAPQPNAAPAQTTAPVAAFKSPSDDLGREIALKSPAKRVIVIGPGAIETVFALGAQKSLVGRDDYADFPPQAKKVAVAGDYQGPNVEQSVALRPDLVILEGETWDKARVEQWQSQLGVPVAALTATDRRAVQSGIEKIGAWLGQNAKARQVADQVRPQAFYGQNSAFIEIERSPLSTAGKNTLVNSVLESNGWKNVAEVSGYQPYNLESLLAAQPDAYIVPSKAKRAEVLEQLRGNAALSKLQCVRQGHVVVIDPDLILRPGPRLALGMIALERASIELTDAKRGTKNGLSTQQITTR